MERMESIGRKFCEEMKIGNKKRTYECASDDRYLRYSKLPIRRERWSMTKHRKTRKIHCIEELMKKDDDVSELVALMESSQFKVTDNELKKVNQKKLVQFSLDSKNEENEDTNQDHITMNSEDDVVSMDPESILDATTIKLLSRLNQAPTFKGFMFAQKHAIFLNSKNEEKDTNQDHTTMNSQIDDVQQY